LGHLVISRSKTAKSIRFAGWVIALDGLIFIAFPEQTTLIFWKDNAPSFWLRSLGFFMVFEGLINYKCAEYEVMSLYRWIMNFRLFQPIFFTVLLLVDFANPGLMLYSTLELLLGVATFFAYKAEN